MQTPEARGPVGARSGEPAVLSGTRSALLSLQHTSGNRAVSDLLHSSGGRPLDPGTREEMEAKFGEDFGHVRIHRDEVAHQATLRSGARAVTEGRDIAFGDGFYAPGSSRGKRLIAHELAHVVQQTRPGERTDSRGAAESEARAAGAQVAGGGNATVQSAAAGAQADPMTKEELRQAIANNEAAAQQASSPEQVQALFAERQQLAADLQASENLPDPPPKPPAPKPVRTDYEADEKAFSGVELEYTARGDYATKDTYSPGVHKSKHYWLAPQMRAGTDKVVYYLAYNPETKRNEYVIGPNRVQAFLDNEHLAWLNAAAAYPLKGDMPDYKAKSARMVTKVMQGKWGEAFQAWKDSWSSAAEDPNFWVTAVTATAGAGVAGAEATELESAAGNLTTADTATANAATDTATANAATDTATANAATDSTATAAQDVPTNAPAPVPDEAPAPVAPATPAPAATPTAATTSDQVFAEIDNELQSVQPAPGELQGTAQNEFQSPRPLSSSATETPIASPRGTAIRESAGASPRGTDFQSASAQTSRSMNTAIRADVGEAEAYKSALERGEIGLERPGGANVPGADFVTAVEDEATGEVTIYANDAKTSSVGKFPTPKGPIPKATWKVEVENAVDRMDLGNPVLEAKIRDALASGRVYVRQINVDYSPAGGGSISVR